MVFELEPTTVAIILLIFLIAGLVKGVMGFGLPIISMALLPFLIDIQTATVLSAIIQPATNIYQLVASKAISKTFENAWPVLVTLVPGVALGGWLLSGLDSGVLLVLVGVSIVIVAAIEFLGAGIRIPPHARIGAGLGFGAVAGVIGALTALNGWVFILYLVGIGQDRSAFRSTIALLFLVSGLLISSSFWVLGFLTPSLVLLSAFTLLPAFLGMWLGDQIGKMIPSQIFRKMVLVALVIIGSSILLRGFLA